MNYRKGKSLFKISMMKRVIFWVILAPTESLIQNHQSTNDWVNDSRIFHSLTQTATDWLTRGAGKKFRLFYLFIERIRIR